MVSMCACFLLPKSPDAPIAAPPDAGRHEHPEHLAALLVASRWVMLAVYISVFVFAPLAPRIFERLGTLIEPDKVREELADLA